VFRSGTLSTAPRYKQVRDIVAYSVKQGSGNSGYEIVIQAIYLVEFSAVFQFFISLSWWQVN